MAGLGRALFAVGSAVLATLAVSSPLPNSTSSPAQAQAIEGVILAVAGRQVAWLNLEAPRNRVVSHIATPANALEVTALPDASAMVVAVTAPFPGGGPRGADLLHLDPTTGDTSPLLQRAEPRESLNMPSWWPDRQTLLFEHQDLGGQPVGAPGQEVPRYPSRIERVLADGSGREIVIGEGRQPDAAPDGTRLVYARTTNLGASLLIWSQADGSIQSLVSEGRFADVAYPRFSPGSDQVAFMAPQSGIGSSAPTLLGLFFGPSVALAHGIPWDAWIVNADGTNLHRAGETGADEPSVSWSPDGPSLFVYSGTGSYIVDVRSGALTPLQFVQGYGPTVWLAAAPS